VIFLTWDFLLVFGAGRINAVLMAIGVLVRYVLYMHLFVVFCKCFSRVTWQFKICIPRGIKWPIAVISFTVQILQVVTSVMRA
jgi:hypothetical protein